MGCNHTYEESLEQNEYRSDEQGLVGCKAGAHILLFKFAPSQVLVKETLDPLLTESEQ
jgi:hypothetical protein